MSSVEEIAQKLIPCTCGGYGVNCTRHMTDCPRHAIAWEDIAAALASERAKFAAFAGPDGQPKSVKWPAVAGVSDRDELWEKYIVRDDEDAHAVLSLIAFIDYRLQAAAEAAKEKNDA